MKKQHLLFFAAFLTCFMPVSSYAQAVVTSLCTPICQFFDGSGNILSGGKIFAYAAGTTTPQPTYTDNTGTTTNAHPIGLNASGMPPNGIFLTANSYKFVAQNSASVQVWVQDGFNNGVSLQSTVSGTFTANGDIVQGQPTAATAGANQSSFNHKSQGTYWTGAVSAIDSWIWQNVLGTGANPTSTYTLSHSGSSGTASVSITQLNLQNLNSVLWVGGTNGYGTMAACYAALPSTGGVCMITPNYTETFSANLTLSKNNAGFIFTGPATITMGSNQVVVNQGVGGAYLKGPNIPSNFAQGLNGVKFLYSGTGAAFLAGSTVGATTGVDFENFALDITAAGSSAIGINWIDVNGGCRLSGVSMNGAGTSQVGVQLDSSGGSFQGDCTFQDNQEGNVKTGVLFNGSAEENLLLNHQISGCAASSIGYDFEGSSFGNQAYGSNINGCTTGVKYGGTSSNNPVSVTLGTFTTSASFGASTTNNTVYQTGQAAPVITWGGTNNRYFFNGKFQNTGIICAVPTGSPITGNGADQTLGSCTIAANIVGPGQGIRVRALALHAAGTASTNYTVKFNGTVVAGPEASSGVDNSAIEGYQCEYINNAGVQNAQTFFCSKHFRSQNVANVGTNDNTIIGGTKSIDFTQAQTLTWTFNVANTDTVQLVLLSVEILQQ